MTVFLYYLFSRDTILTIMTALLGYYSIKLAAYVVLIKSRDIFTVLTKSMAILAEVTVKEIKSYDRRHGLLKGALCLMCGFSMAGYLILNGISQDVLALVMGLRTKESGDQTIATIGLMIYYVAFCGFITQVHFYNTTLYVAAQLADNVRSKLIQTKISVTPDYLLMRRSLEACNLLMQTVNMELGTIPFSLLAMAFVSFSCSISYLVTCKGILAVTPFYAAITFGSMNLVFLFYLFQVIELSIRVHNSMAEAWQLAKDYASDPETTITTPESRKAWTSLQFFLMTESVVPAKAGNNIVIDRSLILSFFNQVIPFTVMMFTTVKELDRLI